ncbi:uncharacterized protein LOC126985948 [Eriocheir sinensis]|uniref:uncharacterized protein LOC126985948 n=1 Tax=Eriocheir sinensis TaxID=95602 RepID=UPI0021C71542|nr:uncharacterized protein LOC126985948 [Eriocheir sinensis]
MAATSLVMMAVMMVVMAVVVVGGHASPAPPPRSAHSSTTDVATPNEHQKNRDGKLFNLQFLPFVSLVVVPPVACRTQSDNSTGTCASAGDCARGGGKADGTCNSGFAVCCVYQLRCGQTLRYNNSYLVNDDYPSTLMDIDNCQYTIQKTNDNVCQIRLDFEKLELAGPDNTSSCSVDTFTFVGTAGSNPTVICGKNNGQHMYLDLGSGNSAARINIATTSTNASRSWRIRVTQLPCSSPSRAPSNCLQYYTDYSGTIKSFNYQNTVGRHQLAAQNYAICIRTRDGFCGIKYIADHFSMSQSAETPTERKGDANCKLDFINVPAVNKDGSVTLEDRYCGSQLNELVTYSKPFEVRVVTNGAEETSEVNNRGFSIRYTQIPC